MRVYTHHTTIISTTIRLFLRRYSSNPNTNFIPNHLPYRFSSAEEAAARRRRKRRHQISPPPHAPRLPDSTSVLVGSRLNLHIRVQSLIRAGDLDAASYAARQAVFRRLLPTVFTCNAVIAAMHRAKRYGNAKALFRYFFRQESIVPNIVSYNNLILSHCDSKEIDEALQVYKEILGTAPFPPSAVTYRHLTKGLVDVGRIDDAVVLLREMLQKCHASAESLIYNNSNNADALVYNNVIVGYLNCGNLDKANEIFDELKELCICRAYDGLVNATFMDWFFNQGKWEEAMETYRDSMSIQHKMAPAARNALLETLLRHGKKKEAWDLFHATFEAVDSDTINIMVNHCFKEGKFHEARDVFVRAPFYMDVAGYNNMITRLCEAGMMDEAEEYYKQLSEKALIPDVDTFRTLIDGYIKVDRVEGVIGKYKEMVEMGLRVITPYANKWFAYMIGKGRARDCVPILLKMSEVEPKPDVMSYDVVMRGLVEAGNVDAAANLLREMNHS